MKKTYKFLLKIELFNKSTDKFGLSIEILSWDERFIWDGDICSDYYPIFNSKENFTLYSHNKGYIFTDILSLPDKNNYGNRPKLYYDFESDEKRYSYLKKLYNCLIEFGSDWEFFRKDNNTNNQISVRNKYWYL